MEVPRTGADFGVDRPGTVSQIVVKNGPAAPSTTVSSTLLGQQRMKSGVKNLGSSCPATVCARRGLVCANALPRRLRYRRDRRCEITTWFSPNILTRIGDCAPGSKISSASGGAPWRFVGQKVRRGAKASPMNQSWWRGPCASNSPTLGQPASLFASRDQFCSLRMNLGGICYPFAPGALPRIHGTAFFGCEIIGGRRPFQGGAASGIFRSRMIRLRWEYAPYVVPASRRRQ